MPDDQNIIKNASAPDSAPAVESLPVDTPIVAEESSGSVSAPVQVAEPLDSERQASSPQATAHVEPLTAQLGGDEPLPEPNEAKPSEQRPQSSDQQAEIAPLIIVQPFRSPIRELLAKAQLAIQNRKRKKLDHIMTLFEKRITITNDQVEKFLRVSDATATRYLSLLEKEGKIKQTGKTGNSVSYFKIL